MLKFKVHINDDQIQTSTLLQNNECGGCSIIESNVIDNTCKDCRCWIEHDELTVSEQGALDALEYANNWIW